jgi:hypothetical protein
MTVGPRIVFTRFASSTSPKLRPWREHVRRVTGTAPDLIGLDGETASVIVWNLVSANNRELGRGAHIYQRFADGVYGWKAAHAGTTEMVCSRWYQTDRDRQHSIAIALVALRGATLRAGARSNHPSLMAGERSAFDD